MLLNEHISLLYLSNPLPFSLLFFHSLFCPSLFTPLLTSPALPIPPFLQLYTSTYSTLHTDILLPSLLSQPTSTHTPTHTQPTHNKCIVSQVVTSQLGRT